MIFHKPPESVDRRALANLQSALAGAGTIEERPDDVPALYLPNGTMICFVAGAFDVWAGDGRELLAFDLTLEQAIRLVKP